MKECQKNGDVLIVGAGPVGLTLAIELARFGVSVRIIDKNAERTDKSKAIVLWSRSLELLQRSGCSIALVDAGYPVSAVHISAGKQSIGHLSLDGIDSAYPYALMLPQSDTERILEEHLLGLGVAVERSVELLQFEDSGEQVCSTLRHGDGSQEMVETAWLMGCDGAHSTVRHWLGMEFHGTTSLIDWVLADVHLEGVPRVPEIDIVWHEDGVLATFPISESRYRIIADVGLAHDATAHPTDPTLDSIQAILDRRFPRQVKATDAVWLSSFRINERKVADYRAGRVFLVGDAAHVHSPAGGQGMNTGMQDAFNLAWKLALVVQGHSSDYLLRSYSEERSPVAEAVLQATGRVTEVATQENHFLQSLRNHTAALVLGLSPVRNMAANAAAELSIGYPHSSLNMSGKHIAPAPGERAPISLDEPMVGSEKMPRFVLFADTDGMPPELLEQHCDLVEMTPRKPFHPDGLWLVRPDGYVALTTKQSDWNAVSDYLDNYKGNRQDAK